MLVGDIRARRRDRAARPAVVAAVCWVVAGALAVTLAIAAASPGAEVRGPGLGEPAWWWGLLLVSGQCLMLVRSPRGPAATVALLAVAAPLAALVGFGDITDVTSVAVVAGVYRATTASRGPHLIWALAMTAALVASGDLLAQLHAGAGPGPASGSALLQGVGVLLVPVTVGVVVNARRQARVAEEARGQAVISEQQALVRIAVERERTAMARELHDVAAHHLTGIAVLTGAIGRQIDSDPEAAKTAVRSVRQQTTAMLGDLRRLVGLLRQDDPAGAAPDRPTLSGLADLVRDARRSGHDVSLTVVESDHGRSLEERVGPLAQLAAYRTVQESLTNAARYAPGARCEVHVDGRDEDHVLITVRNDSAPETTRAAAVGTAHPGSGGYGLLTMKERAALTQSRLSYGPRPEGGWLVSLAVPSTEPPAASPRAPAGGSSGRGTP